MMETITTIHGRERYHIFAQEGERLQLMAASPDCNFDDFLDGVLREFLPTSICPHFAICNKFFRELLAGRSDKAELTGVTFGKSGLTVDYNLKKGALLLPHEAHLSFNDQLDRSYFYLEVNVLDAEGLKVHQRFRVLFNRKEYSISGLDGTNRKIYLLDKVPGPVYGWQRLADE